MIDHENMIIGTIVNKTNATKVTEQLYLRPTPYFPRSYSKRSIQLANQTVFKPKKNLFLRLKSFLGG